MDFLGTQRSESQFPNGLRVVLYKNNFSSIHCIAMSRAGSRYDDPRFPGINHLIEHLIFRNAKNIESVGGHFNAHTDKELMSINAVIGDKSEFGAIANFYKAIFTEAVFTEETLESEKNIIRHEFEKINTSPVNARINSIYHLFFGGSALDHPVIGYKDNLKNVSLNNIHEQYRKIMDVSRITIIISGNIEMSQITDELKGITFFADHPFVPDTFISKFPVDNKLQWPATINRNYIFYGTYYRNHFDRRDTHQFLLMSLLANQYSSKLFTRLRLEKNLTYRLSVGAFGAFDLANGIITECEDDDLQEIIDQIRNVINDILENGVSEEELQVIKNNFLKSLKIKSEYPAYFAKSNALYDTFALNRGMDDITQEVQEATVEDLMLAAETCFDLKKWKLVSVGKKNIADIKL